MLGGCARSDATCQVYLTVRGQRRALFVFLWLRVAVFLLCGCQLEPFSWSLTVNFKLLSLCGDPVVFPNTCFVPPAVNVLPVPVAHFVQR